MRRLIARPGVHFLLLGALLVAADRWLLRDAPADEPARGAIEIDRARIEELRADWIARTGEPPDAQAERTLIEAEIDDEILLREARLRGFEVGDPVVRARLARNVGFIRGEDERQARAGDARRVGDALAFGLAQSDLVVRRRSIERMRAELAASESAPPSADEIASRFARERDMRPGSPRVRISHAFLSRDRRGAALEADALRLRRQVESDALASDAAVTRGDAFLLGHAFPPRTQAELARAFGVAFAREVFALEPGGVSEPIASSYGLHLVFVHERSEAAPMTLDAERARIASDLVREREAAALRFALDALRARYEIRVGEAGS